MRNRWQNREPDPVPACVMTVPVMTVPVTTVPVTTVPVTTVPVTTVPVTTVRATAVNAATVPARRAFPAPGGPAGRLRWPPDESWCPGTGPDAPAGPVSASRSPDRLDWLIGSIDDLDGIDNEATQPGIAFFTNPDGAPAASMPGLRGRFAAEWCRTGTSSRVSSLLRGRGRTDGGVMVRRALLDRGDLDSADDEALPLSQPLPVRPDQVAAHWRGAGGRWLIWIARAIVWAVILLIGYRGILAIVDGRSSAAPASSTPAPSATQFPVTLADAYALQFGDVYLNFSPASAGQRGRELARFLPPGADPQLGWDGVGTQRVLDEQVAGVSVSGPHSAVVTLLARLSAGRLIELGVPVYAAQGGMIVSGDPALLPAPAKVTPPAASQTGDQATANALASQLPAFFEAFASGDRATLARFTSPGAQIGGLGGAVTFGAVDSVYAPPGGSRRQISVTVTWQLPTAQSASTGGSVGAGAASVQMTYEMTVVRQQGTWDVQSIGASTTALTQGPP
jgi:Conjugative transposon protein TcpC